MGEATGCNPSAPVCELQEGLLGTFIIEDKESHSGIAEDQEGKDTARP